MRNQLIILFLLGFISTAAAQQPQAKFSIEQSVLDDDGGRAFILNSKFKLLTEVRRAPGAVIDSPQQCSIFLGSDWSSSPLHEREPKLSTLLASVSNQLDANKLAAVGIEDFFAATYSLEVPIVFAEGERISDLRVRAVLAELINSRSLPPTESSTIYMIFLPPRLISTLGTLTGRKHYLSYHNFYNVAGKRLHYVVVPYESDWETARAIALRALVAAALNPNGEAAN
jgi:hypothetical protein